MIVDPWGKVMQSAKEGEETVVADLGKFTFNSIDLIFDINWLIGNKYLQIRLWFKKSENKFRFQNNAVWICMKLALKTIPTK